MLQLESDRLISFRRWNSSTVTSEKDRSIECNGHERVTISHVYSLEAEIFSGHGTYTPMPRRKTCLFWWLPNRTTRIEKLLGIPSFFCAHRFPAFSYSEFLERAFGRLSPRSGTRYTICVRSARSSERLGAAVRFAFIEFPFNGHVSATKVIICAAFIIISIATATIDFCARQR